MKCENFNCFNEVDIEHIEHLCAGYEGGLECDARNRFCSCCHECRQLCINDMQEEEKNDDEY